MATQIITQEIEAYVRTIEVLDSALVKDDANFQKRKQALARLRSKVTIQDATVALEDASRRNDEDDRKDAEKALSALMSSLPEEAALGMIQQGLTSPDSKLRVASLHKLVEYISGRGEETLFQLALIRVMDIESSVAKVALEFAKKYLCSEEHRQFVFDELQRIESGKVTGDANCAGKDVYLLRIWELGAQLLNTSQDQWVMQRSSDLLSAMFEHLQTWNDDVLFVLNQLEIAASLPRAAFGAYASKLVPILLRYATDEELVADDALRVLAALHFDKNNSSSRPAFFSAVDKRMSPEFFSLASLEVVGLFIGANSECLQYALNNHKSTLDRWLELINRFANDGSDVPRNVALDAVGKALRGGSLLKQPNVSLSTLFKTEGSAEYSDSALTSPLLYSVLKDSLPNLLRSVNAAIRSLHPHIQVAGYLLIRMMASQNSKWGVIKVFEHIPKETLLNQEMPSPNTNMQCVEARYAAISSCALKFLTDEGDAGLLRAVKQFVLLSKDPAGGLKFKAPSVEVATMRA